MEEKITLDALLEAIQSDDAEGRTQAMLAAGQVGAPALKPLARISATGDLEVGRAAKRAMWKVVRVVGAPGAKGKDDVLAELHGLLGPGMPDTLRAEVIWMLSEIGTSDSVEVLMAIPDLGGNSRLCEDVRCAIERIPGRASIKALRKAMQKAPDAIKPAIAQSLRALGQEVDGFPCQKLVPTKQTTVTAVKG